MNDEGSGNAVFFILLIGGVALLVWYVLRQQQQSTQQTTLQNLKPLPGGEVPTVGPPGVAQQLEYTTMSSIPVVGPLSPLVNAAANAIATSPGLEKSGSLGYIYTDQYGVTHPASEAQVGIVAVNYNTGKQLPGAGAVERGLTATYHFISSGRVFEPWKW